MDDSDVTIQIQEERGGRPPAVDPGHVRIRRGQTVAWENRTNGRSRVCFPRGDLFEGGDRPVVDVGPDDRSRPVRVREDLERGRVPYAVFLRRSDHSFDVAEGGSHPMMIIL
jgi:hypothetical protein